MIYRHAKMRRHAQREREQQSQADSTTIAKLPIKFDNLQKVSYSLLALFSFEKYI